MTGLDGRDAARVRAEQLPERVHHPDYVRHQLPEELMVPSVY